MSSMFFHIKNPSHNDHFMKVNIKLLKYLSLSSFASLFFFSFLIPTAHVVAILCFSSFVLSLLGGFTEV